MAQLAWLNSRTRPQSNTHNRFRLTRAMAKFQKTEVLVEFYESAQTLLRLERDEPGTIGPAKLAKAKRDRVILRTALRKRGFEADALDYDPTEVDDDEPETSAAL